MMKLKVTVAQKQIVLKGKSYLHPVLGTHQPSLELDNSITVPDCHGTRCKVDMNSPFQLQDKETLDSLAEILCATGTKFILG